MKLPIGLTGILAASLFVSEAYAQKPTRPKRDSAAVPVPALVPAAIPPAAAPSTPSLADTLEGDSKADYASGKVLYADGDHAGSLVKFSSAYARSKDPRLLWNMAACEKNLRHYARSLHLIRQYLKEGEAVLGAQDKSDARELVQVMEPFTATLQVTIDEPGAELSIDDEAIGGSPVPPVVVDIGLRKLRVRKEGFEEVLKDVPVGGAARVSVAIAMVKIIHDGRLSVHASPGSTVLVDGRVVGTGGWSGVLSTGGHTLKVTAPKMRTYQAEVLIQDRQAREVAVTLEPEPSKGLPTWVWVAGGVVLAGGLATGGYFLFKGEPTYSGPSGNLNPGIVQASRPIQFR